MSVSFPGLNSNTRPPMSDWTNGGSCKEINCCRSVFHVTTGTAFPCILVGDNHVSCLHARLNFTILPVSFHLLRQMESLLPEVGHPPPPSHEGIAFLEISVSINARDKNVVWGKETTGSRINAPQRDCGRVSYRSELIPCPFLHTNCYILYVKCA